MENMMSEIKKYKCSCQLNIIYSSKLKDHISLENNHKIRLAPIYKKVKKPKKSESQINLKHSIAKQFTETHSDNMNFASIFIKNS